MSFSTIPPHVLVQGTADWNQPIATNQHYVVRELAHSFNVSFVESLGLRRPEFKVRDLKRMLKRLIPVAGDFESGRTRPDTVNIISPRIIPIHSSPWKYINMRLLTKKIEKHSYGGARIYWTFSPITYGLESTATATIYHCVDLLGEFPGIERKLILESERALAAKGATAIGSSEVVVDHLKRQGFRKVLYWKNVADTEVILSNMENVENNDRRGALFAGNLSDKKIDFALLADLVESGVEVHLAGPVAEGGGASRQLVDELVLAGAQYHGVLSLEDLARLMSKCRIGLIPYQLNAYTNGVSPLKTYEYMAAGLAVVSTHLPGVQEVKDHVFVATSSAEFIKKTSNWVQFYDQDQLLKRQKMAELHSWSGRGQECRSLATDLLS